MEYILTINYWSVEAQGCLIVIQLDQAAIAATVGHGGRKIFKRRMDGPSPKRARKKNRNDK